MNYREPYREFRRSSSKGAWAELRKRRVFPLLGIFIASGFLVVEGIDQAIGHGLLPAIAYQLALVFYLFGIPGTAILAWFHGEKGPQKPTLTEAWMHGFMLVGALGICYGLIRGHDTETGAAAEALGRGLDPQRVAVLYFEDHGPSGELRYLADAVTEALIDQLSQARSLDVISRNGVEWFRRPSIALDSVVRALEAGSLIMGTVEERDESVRVIARLIDGLSGAEVRRWSFDAPMSDLLSIERFFAEEAALFLSQRLGGGIRMGYRRATSLSPEAWTLVQRAERLRKDAEEHIDEGGYSIGSAGLAAADSILALAELTDPSWIEPTLLRGEIADRRARLAHGHAEYEQWAQIGRGHAERALSLDPNHARALELRGTLDYCRWVCRTPPDPAAADRLINAARSDLEAATRLDPSLARAHSTLSHLYHQIGDVPAAVLSARRAYDADPYLERDNRILFRLSNGSLDVELLSRAERWCEEGVSPSLPDYRFAICHLRLMTTPAAQPNVDIAQELVASLDSLAPEDERIYWQLKGEMLYGGILARAGLADSARSVLGRARSRVSRQIDPNRELPAVEAYMLTLLGDYEEAVALLTSRVRALNNSSVEYFGQAAHGAGDPLNGRSASDGRDHWHSWATASSHGTEAQSPPLRSP